MTYVWHHKLHLCDINKVSEFDKLLSFDSLIDKQNFRFTMTSKNYQEGGVGMINKLKFVLHKQ